MRKPVFEVVQSDVLVALQHVPDASVQCIVTSFPYWRLRDYCGHPEQLGLEPTFAEFVQKCVVISRELRRVLRKDGTFFLNMGKSYGGKRSFQGKADDTDGVFARRAARLGNLSEGAPEPEGDDAFARRDLRHGGLGHDRDPAFKDEDLCMQGHLLAEALRQDGWWLRSDNVWWKNAMPESVTSRTANTHENVFLLTKSRDYFWDAEAVRTAAKTKDGKGTAHLRSVWDDCGPNFTAADFADELWREFLDFAAERLTTMGDVWKISNESFPLGHFAVFSTKLVERCVKAGTPEAGCCPKCQAPWRRTVTLGEPDLEHRAACGGTGEDGTYRGKSTKGHDAVGVQDASEVKKRILEGMRERISTWAPGCECRASDGSIPESIPSLVLDPFCGTGRTLKASLALGRDAVGIELVPEYAAMARQNAADPGWEVAQRDRIRAERKSEKATAKSA